MQRHHRAMQRSIIQRSRPDELLMGILYDMDCLECRIRRRKPPCSPALLPKKQRKMR